MKTYHWRLSFILSISVALLFYSQPANAQICSVNAGIDKTICVTQQPLVLSGSTGISQSSPPTYLWTKLGGPPATITTADALTTNVTGLTPGNYVFQLSSKCIDGLYAKDIIAITVLPEPPTAIAGPDRSICFNAPIQLSANSVNAPFVGTWTVSPIGGTFSPNANDPNAIYTAPPRSGVRRFTWTISNGQCKTTDFMNLTVAEPALPVSAGPDDTLACKGPCTTMHASYEGYAPQNGLWTVISGPNTPVFSDASSPVSKVCSLVPGNYVFRWTVSGPCFNGSDEMTLHVDNINNPPNTFSDQVYANFCEDPSVTSEVLIGPPVAPGDSVTWTQTGGGSIAAFSPDNHHATVMVDNLTGTFPYKFTYAYISAAGCSIVTTYTVYRSQLITGLTDPPDQELPCDVTATSFNISYNKVNTIGNNLVRRSMLVSGPIDSGRIVISNSALSGVIRTDTWSVSNLVAAGTYIYRLEYSNPCGSFFEDISITVSRTPGIVNAGSDIILPCHGMNVTPTGSVNAPGIYTWSQVSGPNTALLTDEHTLVPSLDGLIHGIYKIRLSNWGGNACPMSTDDMNITVTQLPPLVATTADDTAICAGNYHLNGNMPLLTETGEWTVMPSSPGIGFYPDQHSPNAFVTGLAPDSSYAFTWTVSNVCGSLSATQHVTTGSFVTSPLPHAGNDLCMLPGTTITTLSGNDPMGANITWTALTPGSSLSANDQQETQVTFMNGSGEYFFEYSLGTPGCGTFTDTVKVVIESSTSINAGADLGICTSTLPYSVTMDGSISSATDSIGGIWSQVSGPAIAIITSPSDPHTGILIPEEGIYQFEYRIMPESSCEYIADTISIRITLTPSDAVAGADQSVCNASVNTIINLSANEPVTGNGRWQIISGPPGSIAPVFSDQSDPNSTIRSLTQGTYHLRWQITNGIGCPVSADDLNLDINVLADAGPDRTACDAANTQLTGNINTNGTWALISGAPGITITANSGNTAIVAGFVASITPPVYRFRYSLPAVGTCASSSDDMVFTNYQAPSQANGGGDKVVCFNETSVILSGVNPSSGTASWLFVSGPNNPSPGPSNNIQSDTTLNNLIPGIYVYKYRVTTNAVCPAFTENIQIVKQANANAQADFRVCNVSTINLDASVPITGQGSWSYISGPLASGVVSFSNIYNPASSVEGLIPGSYIYRWSIDANGTCPADYDDIQVIIDPPVSPVDIGSDQSFCQGTVAPIVFGTNAIPGVSYSWSPTTLLSNSFTTHPSFQGVDNAGNYTYTLKASIGACTAFSSINITVKPMPFANIEIADDGCAAIFMASDPGAGVNNPLYNWNFGIDSNPELISGQGPHHVTFQHAASSNIQLEIISADGCSNHASVVYAPSCVLPVNLTSFEAGWKGNYAELIWNVEQAINFDHFEIERSYDGRQFVFLDQTAYINNVMHYMYPDKTVNTLLYKEVFYRLKMVDHNDHFTYSSIKKISLQKSEDPVVSIWPNPFTSSIKIGYGIQAVPENLSVKIYNAIGEVVVKKVFKMNTGNSVAELDGLGKLAPGFYTLQIISNNKIIGNHKIIKRAW